MPISVEEISPEHVAAAKGVIRATWAEFLDNHPKEEVRLYAEQGLSDLDDVEQRYFARRGTFLVALDDNLVVGTGGICGVDRETCELRRMFILRAYREKGVGTQLFIELPRFARTVGYKEMKLGTNKAFTGAHHFYRNLGFVNDDTRFDERELTDYLRLYL
jgi:putative acetyltransferase